MYVYDAPPPPDTEDVIAALRNVHDPEIPVNIYDLGLIYELAIAENGDVRIQMTLTAPACPVAGELPQDVANAVNTVEGVGEITVTLTWDPPWTPERMSDVARVALDMF
jgi:FeS assembly SUF system protein